MKVFSFVFAVVLLSLPCLSVAENGFVEGTVFNKKTGIPVANAQVSLWAFDGLVCPAHVVVCPPYTGIRRVGEISTTDGNGFYSIEVSADGLRLARLLGKMQLRATCVSRSRLVESDPNAHLVYVHEGVETRNLYLDVSWSRRFDTCDLD